MSDLSDMNDPTDAPTSLKRPLDAIQTSEVANLDNLNQEELELQQTSLEDVLITPPSSKKFKLDAHNGTSNQSDEDLELAELQPPNDDEEIPMDNFQASTTNEVDLVGTQDSEQDDTQDVSANEEEDSEADASSSERQDRQTARVLLSQLDNDTRSRLCLYAMEKIGESIFEGHEDERDAMLVDASTNSIVLDSIRETVHANREEQLGTSSAPVEVEEEEEDFDDDDGEIENDEDEEICLISEEENGQEDSQEQTGGNANDTF